MLVIRVNFIKAVTVILITIHKFFFVKLQKLYFNFLSSQRSFFVKQRKYCFNFQSNQDNFFLTFFVLVYIKSFKVNIVQATISLQKSLLEQSENSEKLVHDHHLKDV